MYIFKKNVLLSFLISLLVVLISLLLSPYYTESDQSAYIKAYYDIKNVDFYESFFLYRSSVTTEEPIHFIITWFFSNILQFDKNFAMSLCNGVLAFLFLRLASILGASLILAIIIVLTNYYFYVFYFAAERLKFAVIFILLAFLFNKKYFFKNIFSFISVLSHLQMIIILFSVRYNNFILSFFTKKTKLIIIKKNIIPYIFLLICILLLFIYFKDYIIWKLPQYYRKISLISIWQISIFMFLSFTYNVSKTSVIALFTPLFILSFIIGPERIVFISYFYFLYYAAKKNRGLNFIVLFTIIYFGIKTLQFISYVILTGQGYGDINV